MLELFTIEDHVPVVKAGQPPREKTQQIVDKMTFMLHNMKINQSFLFQGISLGTARKHVNERFPEFKTRISMIDKDKKIYRIWRIL